jgi:hypothetical protein
MKKNQIDQNVQHSDSMSNEPTPEKNKEFQEKNPEVIDPKENDPTRKDKPPFIINKHC